MDEAARSGWTRVDQPEQEQGQQEPRSPSDSDAKDAAEEGAAAKLEEAAKQSAREETQEYAIPAEDAASEQGAGAGQVATVAKDNPVPVAVATAMIFALLIWVLKR